MHKMNFPVLWRKWIMECVTTASASVLVNGSPTYDISPFLFLNAAEGLSVMMNALVKVDLFSGYQVGQADTIHISHLQFADDTLLVGNKSWANIWSKSLLMLFEVTSGLKINFRKSMLVGVNASDSLLNEASVVLNCKIGHIPFMYPGLPIGSDFRKLNFWKPLVEMVNFRLSRWKSRKLSLGGRLVLLKSVMSSLSIYFLSFFKALAGIITSLKSIFNFFFWGVEKIRKISWINWETICLKKGMKVWCQED